jgi:hypothetical protein
MNQSFIALALQEAATNDSSMWIIIIVVLLILFLIVVIVVVGLIIFFVMRKRKKAQSAAAQPGLVMSAGPAEPPPAPAFEPPPAMPSYPPAAEASAFATPEATSEAASSPESPAFDPTRTVAIKREEETVTMDYGSIKFVSGVLTGEQFVVDPEGVYIGRESTLSQIVVSDPRISKRHLWIGVREGVVTIVDQDSRNGTFINDPKSERVTEATLHSGDTVIMGESDVARFEYHN